MSRTLCPDCGATRGVQTSTNLSFCHSCHKTTFSKSLIELDHRIVDSIDIPKDLEQTLPTKVYEWLTQYYITLTHVKDHDIYWSNSIQRIVFLYNNSKSAWARSINPKARNKWLHLGNKSSYFIRNHKTSIQACYVEDVISAIRVSDYIPCNALGGTNISDTITGPHLKNAVTWFDGDKAGQKAAEAFRKKYKLYLNIRNIMTKKDPKCHTPSEMKEILNERE